MIYIGKVVNTHGLKGEIRIISDFKEKDKVFIVNNELVIADKNYKILSYRRHKNYDMVCLENVNYDEAVNLKNSKVFVKRDNIKTNFISLDLVGMEAYDNEKLIGKITDVINGKQDILVINKKILVPYVDEFILKIEDNKVYINVIEGLINEN